MTVWDEIGFEEQEPSVAQRFGRVGKPSNGAGTEKQRFGRAAGRAGALGLTGLVSGAAGTLGNLLSLLRLQGEEMPSAARERYELTQQTKPGLQFLHSIVPTLGRVPTSQDIQELSGMEPENALERIISRGAELAGGGTLGGSSAALTGALAGGVAQSGRELGLPEGVAAGIEIGAPFAKGIVGKNIGKKVPQVGKRVRIGAKEMAPLELGKVKAGTIRAIGKPSTAQKVLSRSKEALDEAFGIVGEHAGEFGEVSVPTRNAMIEKLDSFIKKAKDTSYEGEGTKKVIQMAEKVRDDFYKGTATPSRMIKATREINSDLNWESPREMRKAAHGINKILASGLEEFPALQEEFLFTNKLNSAYHDVQGKLGKKGLSKLADLGEGLAAVKSLMSFDLGGLATVGGADMSRRALTRYLMSPRSQNMMSRIASAVKKGSASNLNSLEKALQKDLKELADDEESAGVDWSALGFEEAS